MSDGRVATWLRLFLSMAILSGIFFRFHNLPSKVYFFDEILTSLHCAGFTLAQYSTAIQDGRTHNALDFQRYEGPASGRDARDVIYALEAEDPQHPPLYFLLEHFWTKTIGNSIADRRLPAAFIGVLVIPAAAWLSFELFGSALAAWLTGAIVAVSPLAVLYSQQAREYSLWCLLFILSSALLIRALRNGSPYLWIMYAAITAIGLYTFTFFILVVAAHAIFMLLVNGLRLTRSGVAFLASTGIAVAAFTPWIAVVAAHWGVAVSETGFSAIPLPPALLAARIAFNATAVFFDAEYRYGLTMLVVPLIALLIAAALIYCALRCPPWPRTFLFTLLLVSALPLIIDDFAFHHSRSTATRYFFPALTAIQLFVAYYLSAMITNTNHPIRKYIWPGMVIGLIFAGALSCLTSLPMRTWWPNIQDADVASMDDVIAKYPHPSVLVANPVLALELSTNLPRHDIAFALTASKRAPVVSHRPILVINPSGQRFVLARYAVRYSAKPLLLPQRTRDPLVENVRAVFARARGLDTSGANGSPGFDTGSSMVLLQPKTRDVSPHARVDLP